EEVRLDADALLIGLRGAGDVGEAAVERRAHGRLDLLDRLLVPRRLRRQRGGEVALLERRDAGQVPALPQRPAQEAEAAAAGAIEPLRRTERSRPHVAALGDRCRDDGAELLRRLAQRLAGGAVRLRGGLGE